MNVYQDITLLGSDEIPINFLWEKVYLQVHLALVEHSKLTGQFTVAASFPEYITGSKHLGKKLRLLACTTDELSKLNVSAKLERLADYVHISSVRSVPEKIKGYVRFARPAVKSSALRNIKRRAKRHNKTLEEAAKHYEGFVQKSNTAPFIRMKSLSSEHGFPLFIVKQEVEFCSDGLGSYDSYGLSCTATTPWF